MTTKNIPISQIENNTGQVEGLPGNPRITNPVKLDKLVESIKHDPEMLQLRGLLVYPFADDKYITIGGNMRLQALKRLNYTECPCIVIPKETPVSKLRNYIVKDNGDFGDWDYKALLAEWDAAELESWAIDVQPFEDEETKEKKRAGWNSGENAQESVCDMVDNIAWHPKRDFSFISCFKKSEEGYPLSLIKSDFDNVAKFAQAAMNVIHRVVGLKNKEGWAIVTTPKRRHKEHNFAESVCIELSGKLGIPFYQEAITAKNRQRINPVFTLHANINEQNIIVFDDILTTGATLDAVNNLLSDKNCFFVVGIDNN